MCIAKPSPPVITSSFLFENPAGLTMDEAGRARQNRGHSVAAFTLPTAALYYPPALGPFFNPGTNYSGPAQPQEQAPPPPYQQSNELTETAAANLAGKFYLNFIYVLLVYLPCKQVLHVLLIVQLVMTANYEI